MNTLRFYFNVLTVLVFMGCHGDHNLKDGQSFNQFPEEENLSPENFIEFSKGKITSILFFDTLLLARNSKKTVKNYFIYSYNMKNKMLVDSLFKLGSEKNEILTPFSAGLVKDNFWVRDVSTMKVVVENLKMPKNFNEFQLKLPLYAIQINDSLQIYGNGDYEKETKIQQIDLRSGKVLKAFGKYDKTPTGIPAMSWRTANESFLFLKPNQKMLVSAYRYTDKIEIFDLATLKSKVISGPESFNIEFKPMQFHGKDIMERVEGTRFAFVGGHMTDKYIYLLYSGNKHMSEHVDFGKSIFVYDWDGNPIRKINLPNYVSCFAVKDDKELYVFDVDAHYIKKANLN